MGKNLEYLRSIGVRERSLQSLAETQIEDCVSYAMEHANDPKLNLHLAQIIDMELRYKGILSLLCDGVATIHQLRMLSYDQLEEVVDMYNAYEDSRTIADLVSEYIVDHQQEKIIFGKMSEGYTPNRRCVVVE